MAATKTYSNLFSGQPLYPASGQQTSPVIDLSTGYGAELNLSLVNGASGSTLGAQYQVQVNSQANGAFWVNFGGALIGPTANNASSSWSLPLPIGVNQVRVLGTNASGLAGAAVTANADLSNVTGI
jgi:hypothetical protein